eukprot:2223750-Pleurochrysis_carterae.AAC.2
MSYHAVDIRAIVLQQGVVRCGLVAAALGGDASRDGSDRLSYLRLWHVQPLLHVRAGKPDSPRSYQSLPFALVTRAGPRS